MEKTIKRTFTSNFIFYVFILLIVLVPMIVNTNSGNPFYIYKNFTLIILGGIFILLLFIQTYSRKGKSLLLLDKNIDLFMSFFLFSYILSTLFSINPFNSYNGYYFRPLGVQIILYLFLIYFFSSSIFIDKEQRKLALIIMEICALMVSLLAISQYLGFGLIFKVENGQRPPSTLGHGIFLAGFLLLVFPFSLIRAIINRHKIYNFLSPIIILIAIIISQTRTAYAGLIIEIAIMIFLYPLVQNKKNINPKKMLIYSSLVFGSIIIFLIFLILFTRDNIYIKRLTAITEIFNNPRWLLWRDSLKIFIQHPLFGSGVSTFPIAFENVYTLEFKMLDVLSNYDNAHNNFVQILSTMGIIGIVTYLLLLGCSIFIAFKSIFSKHLQSDRKLLYTAFLSMISGYIVFGLADFDDLSIMLYLFVFLSILKFEYSSDNNLALFKFPSKPSILKNPGIIILFILTTSFLFYNFYKTVIHLKADRNFAAASVLISINKYQPSLEYFVSAINLWENNPLYKYKYGETLLKYAISDTTLSPSSKHALLENARFEFLSIKDSYTSKKDCLSLISISDFEMGETIDADKIKNELLESDSLMIPFRTALAQFYYGKKNFNDAIKQILFVSKYDQKSIIVNQIIEAILNDKNCPEPKHFCQNILSIEPDNKAANEYLRSKK